MAESENPTEKSEVPSSLPLDKRALHALALLRRKGSLHDASGNSMVSKHGLVRQKTGELVVQIDCVTSKADGGDSDSSGKMEAVKSPKGGTLHKTPTYRTDRTDYTVDISESGPRGAHLHIEDHQNDMDGLADEQQWNHVSEQTVSAILKLEAPADGSKDIGTRQQHQPQQNAASDANPPLERKGVQDNDMKAKDKELLSCCRKEARQQRNNGVRATAA
ncbi:unnamed protein product [Vitrella brassicaformis CCMP3155]|uniref:Uncharacterized protein n=1 Tax=Vitrella brassicaformis (strain CCMP3155) TaxID=1169540 RepID=A0A0G4FA67_VITBC|nr:unnamed protein product [Vitrella brassicaformis CCMP3155]|eukprot:CEM09771.1 unnamed protein product [Vitrella brassicaformis CCMP3155]